MPNTDEQKHVASFDRIYSSNPWIKHILEGNEIHTSEEILEYSNKTTGYYHRQFNHNIYSNLGLKDYYNVLCVGSLYGFDEKNIKALYPDLKLNLYGIDISKAGVYIANKNNPVAQYSVAFAEQLPFPDNCFDCVYSREVIEHVIDPSIMMSEIYRVLKPQGRALITTPNADSIATEHIIKKINNTFKTSIWKYKEDFKDDHMTIRQLKKHFRLFKINKIIYDGNLYFLNSSLKNSSLGLFLAKITLFLGEMPLLDRIFCDQVKFVLEKKNTGEMINEVRYMEPLTGLSLDTNGFCPQSKMDYYDDDIQGLNFINKHTKLEFVHDDLKKDTLSNREMRKLNKIIWFSGITALYGLFFLIVLPISLVIKVINND